MTSPCLVVVGNPGTVHIGSHLLRAAQSLKLSVQFCDNTQAWSAPWWLEKFNWWFGGHRPSFIKKFGRELVRSFGQFKPSTLLATGFSPIEVDTLQELGKRKIQRLLYLTDDPWNPAQWSAWFVKTLPFYDHIFSVRRSNIEDLGRLGCRKVSYLPFAYAPEIHYAEPPAAEEKGRYDSDIVFVGGADRDRVPYISVLIKQGFKLGLYGTYWDRFGETRVHARGPANPRTMRLAMGGAKIALCLVRRANRDGNSMRTFEIPAIGACMLTEDTNEHREIFGEEGRAVVYFRSVSEMIEKLRWLLNHEIESKRLAHSAHQLIMNGRNTYRDRLASMLALSLK